MGRTQIDATQTNWLQQSRKHQNIQERRGEIDQRKKKKTKFNPSSLSN